MSTETLDLLFLEVDMTNSGKKSCAACDVTIEKLNQALDLAKPILNEAGYEIRVNRILVSSEDEARALRFHGSPTLRVRGAEIAPQHDLDSDVRVWSWGGREFSEPPVGLFLDLILQGIRKESLNGDATQPREIQAYVKQYLTGAASETKASCNTCS